MRVGAVIAAAGKSGGYKSYDKKFQESSRG